MKFIGKFIISERRGTICNLRGRRKKGRGRGRGRGKGENSKVSYPLSPILLPFSLPPYPLPDSTPATKARPFDERHYLGKTLRRVLFSLVCIKKKKTLYKECRIGLWLVRSFLPFISCYVYVRAASMFVSLFSRPACGRGVAWRHKVPLCCRLINNSQRETGWKFAKLWKVLKTGFLAFFNRVKNALSCNIFTK